MSKETEKIFKEPDKFIAENSDAPCEPKENLQNMLNSFMSQRQPWANEVTEDNAESSDDYLELAESAATKKTALKYAKKAAQLDPDNIDAAVMVAELTASSIEKLIEKYKSLIEEAEEKLKAEGYFDNDCIGEFWGLFETRPYMRLLDKYSDNLVQCGKMRLAIAEYEKMLKLCENDNLGARYRLMHLYVFLEDEQSALRLFKEYSDEESTQFLLPLSILYYKLGNLRDANNYLKRLCAVNNDTIKFFNGLVKGDSLEHFKNMNSFGYRPFTIEEFLVESEENVFLFQSVSAYFEWAWQKLKSKNK